MSDRANLFGVNCSISLVGFIVLLCCLVHEKKKHMDTFEKLRVIIAVTIRESVGNEGGLRRGLEAASRKEEASSLGYIPRCAVAESLWFKHFEAVHPSACVLLNSHEQCMKNSFLHTLVNTYYLSL